MSSSIKSNLIKAPTGSLKRIDSSKTKSNKKDKTKKSSSNTKKIKKNEIKKNKKNFKERKEEFKKKGRLVGLELKKLGFSLWDNFRTVFNIRIKNKTIFITMGDNKTKIKFKHILYTLLIIGLILFRAISFEKEMQEEPKTPIVKSTLMYPITLSSIKYYEIDNIGKQKFITGQQIVSSLKADNFSNEDINEVLKQINYEYMQEHKVDVSNDVKIALAFGVLSFICFFFNKTKNLAIFTALTSITIVITIISVV